MKHSVILFVCLLLSAAPGRAQELPIEGPWKFQKGDDARWRDPVFDDAGWTELNVQERWEAQLGVEYDGYAWYRKTMVIPSTLKQWAERYGVLLLDLGAIDDTDETFLNGRRIGSTDHYEKPRRYALPFEAVRWDAPNVIAVRVNDTGGGGGMWRGLPLLRGAAARDFLLCDLDAGQPAQAVLTPGKTIPFEVSVRNISAKNIPGIVELEILNTPGDTIFKGNKTVELKPGENRIEWAYTSGASNLMAVRARVKVDGIEIWKGSKIFGYQPVAAYSRVDPKIPYAVKERFIPIEYEKQSFGGWWGRRLKANLEKRLLNVDEETLLAGFFQRPGAQDWIGEHVGKYLETAANTYRLMPDGRLKTQMDRIAQQLIACQLPDGYLGTYTDDQRWTSWDVWIHKYDLYGLLAYYQLSGYEPAFTACRNIGDLLCRTFGPGKRDIIASGTHVGMAATSILDPMLDLYRLSGEQRYLDFCKYLVQSYEQPNGPKIISTLNKLGRVDKTANAKAYEMLSNLAGLVKLFKVTGDSAYLHPVLIAWNDIVKNRLYVTGSASSFEHFQDDRVLPGEADKHIGEGCVSTTWLQLNLALLTLTAEERYAAEIEKTAYNHLTGAENPQTGCVSYYTPLLGQKPYGCTVNCCVSSVPRGIALMSGYTRGYVDGQLTLFGYEPGRFEARLGEKSVQVEVRSDYPASGNVIIRILSEAPVGGTVLLRKPGWAAGFHVAPGKGQTQRIQGRFAAIQSLWNKKTPLTVGIDLDIKPLEDANNYPGRIGFQRGPQVLALDAKLNGLTDFEGLQFESPGPGKVLAQKQTDAWAGTPGFRLPATLNGKKRILTLVPYADACQTEGLFTIWMERAH